MWVTLMPVMTTAVKLSRVASSAIRVLRQSSSSLMWELSPICHTHMANCHIHCHTYYQTQTENCRVSPPQLSEFWDSRRRLWELSPICHTHKANCHTYTVTHTVNCHSSLDKYGKQSPKCHLCSVLFCSLAVLDPRVGHVIDVLSPYISVLCHSDWLFHGESCPCLDVVHPGRLWSTSPACTWHCSFHYLFLQATPLFLVVWLALTVSSSSLYSSYVKNPLICFLCCPRNPQNLSQSFRLKCHIHTMNCQRQTAVSNCLLHML